MTDDTSTTPNGDAVDAVTSAEPTVEATSAPSPTPAESTQEQAQEVKDAGSEAESKREEVEAAADKIEVEAAAEKIVEAAAEKIEVEVAEEKMEEEESVKRQEEDVEQIQQEETEKRSQDEESEKSRQEEAEKKRLEEEDAAKQREEVEEEERRKNDEYWENQEAEADVQEKEADRREECVEEQAENDMAEDAQEKVQEEEQQRREESDTEKQGQEEAVDETHGEASNSTQDADAQMKEEGDADAQMKEEGDAEMKVQEDEPEKAGPEKTAPEVEPESSGQEVHAENEPAQDDEAARGTQDEAAKSGQDKEDTSKDQGVKRKAEEMEEPTVNGESEKSEAFAPGKRVKLHSLKAAADLNGQFGFLVELAANGRWECQLPDRKIKIKPDNLILVPGEAKRERSRSRDRSEASRTGADAGSGAGAQQSPEADAGAGGSAGHPADPDADPLACSNCGAELAADAAFCRKCGAKVPGRESPPEPAASSSTAGVADDRPPGDNRPPPEEISDNHYEALGLTFRASESEIKKAYLKGSMKHHPDKNPGDEGATRRFQRIMEAYNILSDRPRRAEYDGGIILKEILGEQRYDQRTHQWVVRNRAAGRDVQSMRLDPQSAQRLLAANHAHNGMYFRNIMQTTGCDILLLDRMNPSVILLGVLPTSPQDGQKAQAVIQGTLAEIDGTKAPSNGLVLVVPQDAGTYVKMNQASQLFQHIYMNLRAHARIASSNRIVVLGGNSIPQAVVQIQSPLAWSAEILLPNGQQMDPWTWAHQCELTGGATPAHGKPGDQFKYLCPPQDPNDPAIVRRLLCIGLGINEEDAKEESIVELAIKVLEAPTKGRRLTCAMVRACTSIPVHAEHSALSKEAQLALLFALIDIVPTAGAAISDRFARTQEFRALQALLEMFRHSSDSVTLRVRCWRVLSGMIPEDGEWHPWEEVLKPEGLLLDFWKSLARWMDDERPPPVEWLQVTRIAYPVLSPCIPRPAEHDKKQGIRRPKPPEDLDPPEENKEEKEKTKQNSTVSLDAQDEAEKLTFLEHVEEAIVSLAAGTDKAFSLKTVWVPMALIAEEVKKRDLSDVGEEGEPAPDVDEKLTTDWFESHRTSFELTKFQQRSTDEAEWKVRVVPAAHIRASARAYERNCGPLREQELNLVEEVLPKLLGDKDSLPRALRAFELAALLCMVSRSQQLLQGNNPFPLDVLLRRISRLPAKDLLHQVYPFSPAMLMRAIVTLGKKRSSWNKETLDVLLQAAALNMHVVEKRLDNPMDRPPATLAQAATALWAAAQHPFSERLNEHLRRGEHNKTPIVQSAALRLQLEVAQQASMSTEGSGFRHFAQMCAWLAHVTVISNLSSDMRSDVLNAFKRLGEVCEELGKKPEVAPCDPEGLCRLAMAVALMGREESGKKQESSGSTRRALEGLAHVVVERAMDEAFDWRPQQLAVLASAYSAAEVPHEGLFAKISEAAERHAMLGNEWSPDQLMKLLHSAQELGQLPTMDKLLKSLDLDQYVKDATARNMPLLFNVIVSMESPNLDLLQELLDGKKTLINQIPLQGILSMLKVWPGQTMSDHPALTTCRSTLVKECVTICQKKAPSTSEMQTIVEAIKEDPKAPQRLSELAQSPALLQVLPPPDANSWSELQKSIHTILSPFVETNVDAPRLEAACAARILQTLERTCSDSRTDCRDFAPAVLELSESALTAMPIVVETVADRLRAKLPRSGAASNATYQSVRDLFMRLTNVVLQYPRRGSGDEALDEWVDRFERHVLGDPRSLRLESVEHLFAKRMPGAIRAELGPNFLTTLLCRSRRLAWNGGRSLQADPPAPRNAVKKLADAGVQLDPSQREKLAGMETESQASRGGPSRAPGRGRSRSRDGGSRNDGRDSGRGGAPEPSRPSRFSSTAPSSSDRSGQLPGPASAADRRPSYGSQPARPDPPKVPTPSAGGAAGLRPPSAATPDRPGSRDPRWGPQPPPGPPARGQYGAPPAPSSRDQLPTRSEPPAGARPEPSRPEPSRPEPSRSGPPGTLVVEGCRDKAMAETLQGTYKMWGMNQNRPVFQRIRDSDKGEQLVLLYYWDERDGPDQMGWWFGTEVGGEEVWAHRGGTSGQGRDVVPPETGWRMLHNQTEDPNMRVVAQGRPAHPVAPSAKGGALTVPPAYRRGPVNTPTAPAPPPRMRGTAAFAATPYGGQQQQPQAASQARPPPPTMAAHHQAQAAPRGPMPANQWTRGQWQQPPPSPSAQRPQAQANPQQHQRQRENALADWLKKLDNGQGQLLQYYDVLAREFDADLSMIAAVKIDGGERRGAGIMGCVDPSFWDTVKVSKMGHRMLFAKGISQL